ncbi:unnamed protein product [Cladocopium goreaui]|uniref:Reticulocyte-binding protein homolog 2a (PfR2Ha) (PfRH2a) [Cleaved into: Reticulocyte-binding protein homolog 2a 85 kDa form Reticulocyte-binding protein homolog 2a 285 kDa form] n=1 Tax=Cladocopium goreaui TaxID=2562237 RepID=A0A9P1FX24_9DINO|nr:unnamed protein product [Cladocopium goreaui]
MAGAGCGWRDAGNTQPVSDFSGLLESNVIQSSSESDEPEEAPTGAPRTDSRKGAAGVADEVEPKKANSKAASRPRDRGPEFSFSALAKRKQEERLQAERLKKDEERAKRKEDLKRDDAPQITEEQKLKLNELKKKQEEVRRQKLREKLEAKQQRAKEREQKRVHLEEQQRSQKERELARKRREEDLSAQLAQAQKEELELQKTMEELKRKAADIAARIAELQRQTASLAKERDNDTPAVGDPSTHKARSSRPGCWWEFQYDGRNIRMIRMR